MNRRRFMAGAGAAVAAAALPAIPGERPFPERVDIEVGESLYAEGLGQHYAEELAKSMKSGRSVFPKMLVDEVRTAFADAHDRWRA